MLDPGEAELAERGAHDLNLVSTACSLRCDEESTIREEGRGEREHLRQMAHAANGDPLEGRGDDAPQLFRGRRHDRSIEAELADREAQKDPLAMTALEKGHARVGPKRLDHEPREPAATADVEHPDIAGRDPSQELDRVDEVSGYDARDVARGDKRIAGVRLDEQGLVRAEFLGRLRCERFA